MFGGNKLDTMIGKLDRMKLLDVDKTTMSFKWNYTIFRHQTSVKR